MEQLPDKPINLPSVAKNLPEFPDYYSNAVYSQIGGISALANRTSDKEADDATEVETVEEVAAPEAAVVETAAPEVEATETSTEE